jgi:hypothetical protein
VRRHPAERRPEPSSPSSGALALLISLSHIFRGSVRWDGDDRVEGLLLQETSVLGAHRLCAQFEGKYSHWSALVVIKIWCRLRSGEAQLLEDEQGRPYIQLPALAIDMLLVSVVSQ